MRHLSRASLALGAVALSLTSTAALASHPIGDLFSPDITAVEKAAALTASGAAATKLIPVTPFNVDMVNADAVPADGSGVYVAVLDTGLLQQAAFFFSNAKIAWDLGKGFTHDITWDDTLGDFVVGPLRDDRGYVTHDASGHGTHVASTIVGFNVNNQAWVRGVAPQATIIPVLVLDAWRVMTPYGEFGLTGGTDEMIAAGIRYVGDLAGKLDGRVIINMSLGGPGPQPLIDEAIDYAVSRGVVIVASAGNEGTAGMGYPGGNRTVISAGASGWASMFLTGWRSNVPEKTNTSDALGNSHQFYLEDFSSRPNKNLDQKNQDLDVSAPGAWVVGPFKGDFEDAPLNYYFLSGTSMAAPHVSGIAALLLQRHPELGQAEVEAIFRLAAAGRPLPANDALVAFPFSDPANYWTSWDGGDYGRGYLLADDVLRVAR